MSPHGEPAWRQITKRILMKREPVRIMMANVSAIDVTNIAVNVTRFKEAEIMCESTWRTNMENEKHN